MNKVTRIRAEYYDSPQAHKPSQDPPESHWHDLVAVTIAIVALLVMVFLASLTDIRQP